MRDVLASTAEGFQLSRSAKCILQMRTVNENVKQKESFCLHTSYWEALADIDQLAIRYVNMCAGEAGEAKNDRLPVYAIAKWICPKFIVSQNGRN